MRLRPVLLLLVALLEPGCAWVLWPFRGVPPALIEVGPGTVSRLTDDADSASLRLAIERSLAYYDREPTRTFVAGSRAYTGGDFAAALRKVLAVLPASGNAAHLDEILRTHFRVLRATGQRQSIRFTGYYTPLLRGRLEPDATHVHPVYAKPHDLMSFDLADMAKSCACVTQLQTGRVQNGSVVPYYSRAEIERDGVLRNRGLEIAWTDDPIALFFLHIQGSGRLVLPDGQVLQLNYAATNGRPFRSISQILANRGLLPPGGGSMQTVRGYLSQHPEQRDTLLHENPRYTFFRVAETTAVGSLGVEVTPGRSMASDPTVFPPGALAFVRTRVPIVASDGQLAGWSPLQRFVLNQDTGGAITGPARVDIYFGVGESAGEIAGRMSAEGDLYFLVPRVVADARSPARPAEALPTAAARSAAWGSREPRSIP
jgi:membrane-bound lytic murein transglycosylase A